jgi:hypothetical protein
MTLTFLKTPGKVFFRLSLNRNVSNILPIRLRLQIGAEDNKEKLTPHPTGSLTLPTRPVAADGG